MSGAVRVIFRAWCGFSVVRCFLFSLGIETVYYFHTISRESVTLCSYLPILGIGLRGAGGVWGA